MKEIKLKSGIIFHNNMSVEVIDFPNGLDKDERVRCKITVEFAESDVRNLQKMGMNIDNAMDYYKEWIYDVVKINLAQDWKCREGYKQIIDVIYEHIKEYY